MAGKRRGYFSHSSAAKRRLVAYAPRRPARRTGWRRSGWRARKQGVKPKFKGPVRGPVIYNRRPKTATKQEDRLAVSLGHTGAQGAEIPIYSSFRPSLPWPAHARARLTYEMTTNMTFTPGAYTSTIVKFSGNNTFDPDLTGIGHQPYLWDQWSAQYGLVRVLGSEIKVRFRYDNQNQPVTGDERIRCMVVADLGASVSSNNIMRNSYPLSGSTTIQKHDEVLGHIPHNRIRQRYHLGMMKRNRTAAATEGARDVVVKGLHTTSDMLESRTGEYGDKTAFIYSTTGYTTTTSAAENFEWQVACQLDENADVAVYPLVKAYVTIDYFVEFWKSAIVTTQS